MSDAIANNGFIISIVDTDTDEVLTTIGPSDTIPVDLVADRSISLSVEAADPDLADRIGSVRLTFDGQSRVENVSPYALFGDSNGDFKGGQSLEAGDYALQISIFSEPNAQGSLLRGVSANFTVGDMENAAPVIETTDFATPEDTPAPGFTIFANDLGFDPEGEDLFFDTVSGVENGSVSVGGSGSVLFYTPDPDFNGEETLTVTVSDRTGQGSQQTTADLLIDVIPEEAENAPPVIETTEFSTPEDTPALSFTIFANDLGFDPEGEDLFFDTVTGAENGSVSVGGSGSVLFYTPDPDFNGEETLTVTVSDRTGQGTQQTTAELVVVVTPEDEDIPADALEIVLIDTATDEIVSTVSPGQVVSEELLADRDLSVSVEVSDPDLGDQVGSIRLTLGDDTRVENVTPYALFGNSGDDFFGGTDFDAGDYVLTIEAFSEGGAGGEFLFSETVAFTVDSDASPLGTDLAAMMGTDTFLI